MEIDVSKALIAQPFDSWHEDIGAVLWWTFPVCEPPYCGTPLDDDWPFDDDERPAWTILIVPSEPVA